MKISDTTLPAVVRHRCASFTIQCGIPRFISDPRDAAKILPEMRLKTKPLSTLITSALITSSVIYSSAAVAQTTDITAQVVANQNIALSSDAVVNLASGIIDYNASTGMTGQGTLTLAGSGTLVLHQSNAITPPPGTESVLLGPGFYGTPGYYSYEGYKASGFLGQYTSISGVNAAEVIIDSGATLELDDGGNVNNQINGVNTDNIIDNGALVVNGSASNPRLGIISGTGSVQVLEGTATMLGVNTFTGPLVIENNMTLYLGLDDQQGSAPDASAIFGNGTLILDTPVNQTLVVPQDVFESHFGNDINVNGNGGLIELPAIYSYTDSGNDFLPGLSTLSDNYVFLAGNASGRGVNIEGGIAQFGDGTTTSFLLPGNPFNTYITLHPNPYEQRGNGGILILDYANSGPTYMNTTIAGGGITFSTFDVNGYSASNYDLPNAAGLGTVIFHQGHIVVTQQQYYNGTTQVDAGATLQLGDGTTGDKTVLTTGANNGLGTIFETSGGDGNILQAGQTVTVGVTQGSNQGTDTSTGFSDQTLTFSEGGDEVSYTITDNTINNGAIIVDNVGATEFTNLSGSGTLFQSGPGTTTLLANTPYTGATEITGGTLAIGPGGSIADSSSLVLAPESSSLAYGPEDRADPSIIAPGGLLSTIAAVGPATFDISQAGNQSVQNLSGAGDTFVLLGSASLTLSETLATDFDGIIADGGIAGGVGGSIVKTGTESLVLNGSNTYTGNTNVEDGALILGESPANAGASLAGSVNVVQGTFEGFGTVNGNLYNGDVALPGLADGVGSLQVRGNYTQTPAGELDINVTPDAASELLVGGGALLAGQLDIIYAPGTYHNSTFTLLSANSISGQFDRIIQLNPPSDFAGSVSYNEGQVVLSLSALSSGSTGQAATLIKQYWTAASAAAASPTSGGSGIWSVASPTWINADGGSVGQWLGQEAIFSGNAGTVAVDGTLPFAELQFITDGYVVSDGILELASSGGLPAVIDVTQGTTATVAASLINGAGTSLQKIGGGTLNLTGANYYSGGTLVSEGVLSIIGDDNLGAANSSLTLDGGTLLINANVSSNRDVFLGSSGGTLNTAANTVSTFSGVIGTSGASAALTKAGPGTLILDGENTFSGSTTVASGTLEVGDEAHDSATLDGGVEVESGAVLRGHGTINGDVTSDGVVWPGGSVGTLTISGNYTQSPGGTLQVDVTPTDASELVVGGTASLSGTLSVIYAPGTYAAKNYTLLQAKDLTGNFARQVSSGSTPSSLSSSISYAANQAELVLGSATSTSSSNGGGGTSSNTSGGGISSSQSIVAPADGSLYANLVTANAIAVQNNVIDNLSERAGLPGHACSDGGAADLSSGRTSCSVDYWVQSSGGNLSLGADRDFRSTAFALDGGITVSATDLLGMGVELGVSQSNGSDLVGGSARVNSEHFGLDAFYDASGYVFSSNADVQHNVYRSSRATGIGYANASPEGMTTSLGIQASKPITAESWTITPKAGAVYQRQSLSQFSESVISTSTLAADYAVSGSHNAYGSLQPYAGVDFTLTYRAGAVDYMPNLSFDYRYTTRGSDPVISVNAQDGTNFLLHSSAASRGIGRITAGVTAAEGDSWRLYFSMSALLAGHARSAMLSVGFNRRF